MGVFFDSPKETFPIFITRICLAERKPRSTFYLNHAFVNSASRNRISWLIY